MRGTFRGVVAGEWETTHGFPARLIMAALIVAAVMAWLATILLILAIVLGIVAALGAGSLAVLWRISRPNDRDQELLGERWAAMHQGTARQAGPPAVTHYHLHVQPGADLSGLDIGAFPLRDAVTTTTEKEW